MTKIAVAGATGMLGHKVCQTLVADGFQVEGWIRADTSAVRRYGPMFRDVALVGGVDVLDDKALGERFELSAPDVLVNAVGLVKQLDAASDPYLAVAVNALLPHRLARLCQDGDARLIHVSTDCVFRGDRGGYREEDQTDAEDLYGRSKALGETLGGETAAVTLRTSFIGRELKRPFHGLVEWFLAQEGGEVHGFDEVIYSGLTSLELSRVISRIVRHHPDLVGVYQVASEPISKYELLRLIRQTYDIDVRIERVTKPRLDRSLLMGPFTDATGYRPPQWSPMVRDMYQDPTPYDGFSSNT